MSLRDKYRKLLLLVTVAVMAGVCLHFETMALKQDRRYSRHRFRRVSMDDPCQERQIDPSRFINCTPTEQKYTCEVPDPITTAGPPVDVDTYDHNIHNPDLSEEDIRYVLDKAVAMLHYLRDLVQKETDPTKIKFLTQDVQNKSIEIANFVLINQGILSSKNQEQLLIRVLGEFEKLGPILASKLDTGESLTFKNPNIEMTTCKTDETFVSDQLAKVPFKFTNNSFLLTRSHQGIGSTLAVSGVILKKTDKVLLGLVKKEKRSTEQLVVNADLLMVTLANAEQNPSEHMIETSMTFKVKEETGLTNPQCYSFHAGDLIPTKQGCKAEQLNISHVQCTCNHLTSFTILMSVERSLQEELDPILPVLTTVCLLLSVFFLILSIATFVYFRNLKSDRNTIHINLSITLALAQLVFLIGVDQVQYKVVCAIVAGTLQFLFLTAFCWMAAEGLQTYVKMIIVFTPSFSMMPIYMALGYGVPTIIVGTSAAIYSQGYGTSQICWLTTKRWFHFSFIGPVLAIVLWNTIMVILAAYVMCRQSPVRSKVTHGGLARARQIKNQVKGILSLLILSGFSWLMGLINFQSAGARVVGYVFILLNGSQGVFVFFFHCYRNKTVKREYRRWLRNAHCLPERLRRMCFVLFKSESDEEFSKTTKDTSTFAQGSSSVQVPISSLVTIGSAPQARTPYKEELARDVAFLSKARTPKVGTESGLEDAEVYLGGPVALPGSTEKTSKHSRFFSTVEMVVPDVTDAMIQDAEIYLGEEVSHPRPPPPLPTPKRLTPTVAATPPPSTDEGEEEASVEQEQEHIIPLASTRSIFQMMFRKSM